jgi:arabinan endo-1,5-alpha-L-arabinosidase
MSSGRILLSILTIGLAASPLLAGTAAAATPARPDNLTAPTVDTPDPSIMKSGSRYFAFSGGKPQQNCVGTTVPMWVPSRSSKSLGVWSATPCFADAMPAGPGAWAGGTGANFYNNWSPSVAENNADGTFLLFYTQARAGSGQRCIGRAQSTAITGPYTPDPTPLICPDGGFWAIDPQAVVVGARLYLAWRQDPNSVSSRIWASEYSTDGKTQLTTPRLLEDSASMTWDGPVPNGHRLIENPSVIFLAATNLWYVSFSGDDYASNNYGTGMAVCGSSLTSGGQCTLQAPKSKSYFGWSGRDHGGTKKTTPGDLPSPGGMSFVTRAHGGFDGAAGHAYVALHYNPSTTCGTNCIRPMAVFEIANLDTKPILTDF